MKIIKIKNTIFLVLILSMVAIIFFYKIQQKNESIEAIETYLEDKNYTNQIYSKEVMRDSKTGLYYMEIVYKDLPTLKYNYYYIKNKDEVRGFAMDETNSEVKTKKYK